MKLLNAFSLNMIQTPGTFTVMEIDTPDAAELLEGYGLESVVGHASTAAVFGRVLGMEVPCNRATVLLERDETAMVGQYVGPRLEEGVTELPEGADIKWMLVHVL